MKQGSSWEVPMKVIKTADSRLLSVPLNGQGEEMRKKKQCSCVLMGLYIYGLFIKVLPEVSLHLEYIWVRTLVLEVSL